MSERVSSFHGQVLPGSLVVDLLKADGLKNQDLFKKQDPYAVLTFGNDKKTSNVKKGAGKTPEWNERFKFATWQHNDETLVIDLYDKDNQTIKRWTGRDDDYIGRATFNLRKLRDRTGVRLTLPVILKGKEHGNVVVVVTYIPDRIQEPPQPPQPPLPPKDSQPHLSPHNSVASDAPPGPSCHDTAKNPSVTTEASPVLNLAMIFRNIVTILPEKLPRLNHPKTRINCDGYAGDSSGCFPTIDFYTGGEATVVPLPEGVKQKPTCWRILEDVNEKTTPPPDLVFAAEVKAGGPSMGDLVQSVQNHIRDSGPTTKFIRKYHEELRAAYQAMQNNEMKRNKTLGVRGAHAATVKADVEKYGPQIRDLAKEIQAAKLADFEALQKLLLKANEVLDKLDSEAFVLREVKEWGAHLKKADPGYSTSVSTRFDTMRILAKKHEEFSKKITTMREWSVSQEGNFRLITQAMTGQLEDAWQFKDEYMRQEADFLDKLTSQGLLQCWPPSLMRDLQQSAVKLGDVYIEYAVKEVEKRLQRIRELQPGALRHWEVGPAGMLQQCEVLVRGALKCLCTLEDIAWIADKEQAKKVLDVYYKVETEFKERGMSWAVMRDQG